MVGGGLLDDATQKIRMDSILPINPSTPDGPGYGIGIVRFAPNVFGHDGQIPGYSTFMVHDAVAQNTIIIGCNLAASPVEGGPNAATVLAKPVIAAMYGASVVPGDPAAAAGGAAGTSTTTG